MVELTPSPQVNTPGPAVGQPAKKSKNVIILLIVALMLFAAVVAAWLVLSSGGEKPLSTPSTNQDVAKVRNDSDLQKLQTELEKTNVDALSKDLDQNDKDAAKF